MLTHAAYHFNSSVQRVIEAKKKRGVRDDIKYT